MSQSEITLASRIESIELRRDVSKGYLGQLRYAVNKFGCWLERAPTISDLHADTVNRWLVHLGATGLSKYTIHTYWRHLRAIWYDAFDEGLTDAHPRRVRKIKKPRLAHTAWTPKQMVLLLAEADKLTGVSKKSRVPRAAFWRALLLTAWDSGLRRGDLLRLKTADVRGYKEFTVVQHKTGWPVVIHLRPETVAAIEIACPGSATRHLGHLTPDLALKHYLDHAQIDRAKPLPPPLPERPPIAGLLPAPGQEGGQS